jgi:hypothetical protein
MARYDPDLVLRAQTSQRFSVLTRGDIQVATVDSWDPDLLRESRVLVPVDVQALVVPPGGDDAIELPGPLSPGHEFDTAVIDGPAPLAPPTRRPAGVHLQWALPDGLLRGRLQDPRGNPGGGLDLDPLPDSWAVLRLLAPADGRDVQLRGWLLDAASGVVRDLAKGPASQPLPLPAARVLAKGELTGTAGGSLTWTGAYDAGYARFAVHDPLEDLTADPTLGGALPGGPAAGAATYLVVGWWSDPDLDPLDGIRTTGGLAERTAELGWRVVTGGGAEPAERQGPLARLADLGLPVRSRLTGPGAGFVRPDVDRDGVRAAARPGLASTAFQASTIGAFQSAGALTFAREAAAWLPGRGVGVEAATLLHGAVVSVPLPPAGGTPDVDLRPERNAVTLTLGEHVDDLVAAAIGGNARRPDGTPLGTDERAAVERLLSALSSGLIARLADPNGLVEMDERQHAAGFAAVDPHEPPIVDRVLTGRAAVPPRPKRPQASGFGPQPPSKLVFVTDAEIKGILREESSTATAARTASLTPPPTTVAAQRSSRVSPLVARTTPPPKGPAAQSAASRPTEAGEQLVERPAPRRYVPIDPMLGVVGAGRGLRHGGDGRADPDERLACRRGSQVVRGYSGLVAGSDVLPALPSGAVPAETLALAREALLLSPHLLGWLTVIATQTTGQAVDRQSAAQRLGVELALRYDKAGGYLGKAPAALTLGRGDLDPVAARTLELLRRHSMLDGVEPDLVAITSWAQPWIPMWLEWRAQVTPADDLSGWRLGPVDLEPDNPDSGDGRPAEPAPIEVTGRTPLTTAPGSALAGAVADWLANEEARDRNKQGEADEETEARLAALGAHAAGLDLLGCSLDGVRTALLGLPVTSLRVKDANGDAVPPTPTGLPELLAAGSVTLVGARIVDAFGRILDLDQLDQPGRVEVPVRAAIAGRPGVLAHPPRFSAPTRCLARLVGAAATDPAAAVDAVVDEVDPTKQVSPVVGFLLPDHVDESIEVFGADGVPLGELSVDARGGGVMWECAPGRALPADAPPGAGLTGDLAALGLFAAGLVAADAQARGGVAADAVGPAGPQESALSAFLRAMDTTLWTVDPVAGAGSSGLASIVGRPVAVVRLTIELDIGDDLDDLTLTADQRGDRALAYAGLARAAVAVRIGELTRNDDGVLGWYADDDYRRCHVVDKVVRDAALEAGRGKGYLGAWGTTPAVPAPDPIDHPYLVTGATDATTTSSDELVLHPGVPRLLTVLMLPGSALTVTAGVVPRQALRLSRAWFAAGLEKLSPSVRVGPVLVDPGEVRLPAVAALGEKQLLTSRDGPLSWRDDAILAATQVALLPDRTSVLREGWIRVDPAGPELTS